ncbi:MAG TPA: ATP-binding protein [Gemmatimonadales bacterium]
MRSFRDALALRMALGMLALFGAVAVASVIALRSLLYGQLDGTLLHIAEVEARHGAASTGSEFAFHEGVLLQAREDAATPLTRFAQLWTSAGEPLVRSRNLERDLELPAEARSHARGGEIGWATHDWNGEQIRSVVFPLERVGAAHGMHLLQVAAPTAPLLRTLRQFGLLLATLSLLAVGGAFAVGRRLAGDALRPTTEITAHAERIRAGTLSERITAHADVQEFGRLVTVLNDMLDRIERAFEGQRRFTADASHELRAPLNVLQGEIDVALRRERSADEYRDVLARCREEVARMAGLVRDLLALARSDAGVLAAQRGALDLTALANRVAERYRPLASAREVGIVATGGTAPAHGDAALLERAIENLVVNAIRHSPRGGTVTVEVEPSRDGAHVLRVRDEGPGIPAGQAEALFTRFFRGDPSRRRGDGSLQEGAGLGLPIARAAAEAHGGTLRFAGNAPGAVFELRVPGHLNEA